ncbi:MAG: GAF domain-containing protein [Chloroflexi bacterium]|nr:GAF domain-containing protein [Chloroflexota bacterium]MCC6893908.1 GAF domain-containing protein [Anaerolineae bacterium]
MLVAELLLHLTRAFFIILSTLTLVDYLRHRDRIRRDIALVFLSLSSTTFILFFLSMTGLQAPWLTKIGQVGIASLPILLLRMVGYFRPVSGKIKRIALIGWAASAVGIMLFDASRDGGAMLLVIVYFVGVSGYAVLAFIKAGVNSTGIARRRLRFAAIASALLVTLIIIVGVRLALPANWPNITPLIQMFTLATVVTFYLAFAPPRWLRQGWQYEELRAYLLEDIAKLDKLALEDVVMRLRQAVMRAIGSQQVHIALWDADSKSLKLDDKASAALLTNAQINTGIIQRVWQFDEPTLVYRAADLSGGDIQILKTLNSEMLFIVPIATADTPLGVLLVFLEYGSLFAEDDLNLLNVFAQQTAIFLENYNVMEQQRRYARDLEGQVQQRTLALQRSNDELRQFAYVASHDLQEPLRMVVSYLQLIETRYKVQLDTEAKEFINFAVDGAKRMKSLIEALLAYSRVETKNQNFTLVDLQNTVNEVLQLMQVSISEKGATVTVDDHLPEIHANEPMMIQLFQNLISNGIKYQKDTRPEVHISAKRVNDEWQFAVHDNGIGIATKDLDRIFIIFQRLHSGVEYPGTGIGLAVCKKVVEMHGGKIWAESGEGEGTTFYFTIPA